MKIIIAHKYWYQKAGAERYVFDMVKLLQEHGHEVIPFAMHHPRNEQTPWSVYFAPSINVLHPSFFEALRIPFHMIYSLSAKKKFRALVRDVKPDIVHIHNIYHHISPSILDVCRAYGIPVVQTIHDYKAICPNYMLFAHGNIDEQCKGGLYWRDILNRSVKHSYGKSALAAMEMYIHHAWLKIYEKNVRAYIMPSQFSLEKFAEFGIPKEKMIHLSYPIDVRNVVPIPSVISADAGIQPEIPSLLAYGRLSEEKGFDVLIRAMKHIPAHLDIIGDGPARKNLEARITYEGVSEKITLHGFLPRARIFEYMKRCACVVVPSVWYEVFPYVILESYTHSKAVIASNCGGMKELVKPIERQYLFTPGDSADCARVITRALANPSALQEYGENGRAYIKKECNPHAHIQKLLDIYKSVILRGRLPLDNIKKDA
jgi:glycosyltransferase involved in cell wall biosynthesis